VGPDNHIIYNRANGAEVKLRVAHSVYFQTLGELGFPALFLYITFLLMGIAAAKRAWSGSILIARQHPDLVWVRDVSFWMMCSFIGYAFGAGFLNMFYIEFPWTAMFLGSMILPLLNQEVARRAQAQAAGNGDPQLADSRRAGSRRLPPSVAASKRRGIY
jgi:hypothetical protein